jgi:hypothetical protein
MTRLTSKHDLYERPKTFLGDKDGKGRELRKTKCRREQRLLCISELYHALHFLSGAKENPSMAKVT